MKDVLGHYTPFLFAPVENLRSNKGPYPPPQSLIIAKNLGGNVTQIPESHIIFQTRGVVKAGGRAGEARGRAGGADWAGTHY